MVFRCSETVFVFARGSPKWWKMIIFHFESRCWSDVHDIHDDRRKKERPNPPTLYNFFGSQMGFSTLSAPDTTILFHNSVFTLLWLWIRFSTLILSFTYHYSVFMKSISVCSKHSPGISIRTSRAPRHKIRISSY
ncbi:hypothetical protein BDV97DRAFT_168325 [Delphinella strobiligena]|nr:hypothetical protein BDV97DRAFT_168325 [Delphinella strobiligena]